jgi:hypothetical protein
MGIQKLPAFILLLILLLPAWILLSSGKPAGNEVQQAIVAGLKENRGEEITKHLNTLTDFDIPGNRGTFSKSQGGRLLQEFLQKNPVKACNVTNTGNSADGGEYTIGDLVAGGKNYRLYFVLKNVEGKWLIHIFKITPQ